MWRALLEIIKICPNNDVSAYQRTCVVYGVHDETIIIIWLMSAWDIRWNFSHMRQRLQIKRITNILIICIMMMMMMVVGISILANHGHSLVHFQCGSRHCHQVPLKNSSVMHGYGSMNLIFIRCKVVIMKRKRMSHLCHVHTSECNCVPSDITDHRSHYYFHGKKMCN